jgi:hypothetical protein
MIATGAIAEADAVRLYGWEEPPASAPVVAFRILRRCDLSECVRFD